MAKALQDRYAVIQTLAESLDVADQIYAKAAVIIKANGTTQPVPGLKRVPKRKNAKKHVFKSIREQIMAKTAKICRRF